MLNISTLFTTDDDKRTFLRGLATIKLSDGKVADEESQFLSNAEAVIHASERMVVIAKEYVGNHTLEECVQSIVFKNKLQVIYFLMEAGRAAYVDGDFAPNEQKVIYAIAERNGIDKATMQVIEAQINREHTFFVEEEELLKDLAK